MTVGELIAENHYAYQKEVANKHGLLSSAEGCGPHLHHGDARMMQGRCDVAMGEFWMPSPHRPEDSQRFMLRDSATAAHVYGMNTVESEAFTTMGTHWEESPAMFKPCADRAFCDGLTRVCYHGMLMSVPLDAFPGDTRRAGAYYSPKVTWWKYSAPMNLYFARCSWMLSRGRFAAGNVLEIAVVNLWANRLIGDAALPPAERIANLNRSENPFKKDHPLLPSGLFGPVSIRGLNSVGTGPSR